MNTYHCSEIEKIIKHICRRICSLLQLLFAEWSEITLLGAPSQNSLNGSCKTSDLTFFGVEQNIDNPEHQQRLAPCVSRPSCLYLKVILS